MEDIIETLIGIEIIDEKDQVVDLQKYAKKNGKRKSEKKKIFKHLANKISYKSKKIFLW